MFFNPECLMEALKFTLNYENDFFFLKCLVYKAKLFRELVSTHFGTIMLV